ncbi:hypothetical protein JYU23_00400 [bacterium AH-315-C07]|nr:hypothetical protein [bacterium AH-315-C07]
MKRQIKYRLCFALLIISHVIHVNGQESFDLSKQFSISELQEDLAYLEKQLINAHPGLYWYSSQSTFQNSVNNLRNGITNPMTELEFLGHIGTLNSVIKCVHTGISPSSNFDSWWMDKALLLPFNIMKVKNEYFIFQNFSEREELNYGTEIISINGTTIEEIVIRLFPYIPADGDNITRKYIGLTRGFYRYYSYYISTFDTNYEIVYQSFEGTQSTINILGISKTLFDQRRNAIKELQDKIPISFKLVDSLKTAVLTVKTFRGGLMAKAQIDFYDFVNESFTRINKEGVNNLIIDLRNNGGGYSEYGAILNSFLADTAFQYCKNQIVTSDQLLPEIKYDIPGTFEGFPNGVIKEKVVYKWPKHSILGWREKADNAFKGQVYFLINGGCVSTTSEVASVAHHNKQGVFIGEEVGGSYLGNSSGVTGRIELPNTKIGIHIAMVKYELAVADIGSRKGVTPDYSITPTISDLVNERDVVMDFTLELIKTK